MLPSSRRRTARALPGVVAVLAVVAVLGTAAILGSANGPGSKASASPAGAAATGPGLSAVPPGTSERGSLPSSASLPVTGIPSISPGPGAEASESPDLEAIDLEEGIDGRMPVSLPARVELYAGSVSVAPGDKLTLHVSTAARQYSFSIERLDATLPGGGEVVERSGTCAGHDYRSLATLNSVARTARANWPVTNTVATTGWAPGVYIVTARDSAGTRGQAIFVVRTPVLQAGEPAFVFTALTYQAYNLWGGANLYSYAGPRATRVSFERPYLQDSGKGFWTRDDDRILAWLQRRGLHLQYTTDYDLSVNPPTVAPRLLIWPRHAEYVTGAIRDWIEQHVDVAGDMNVLNFGSNGFYWQVRLAPPKTKGAPMDVVCYKSATKDPMTATDPDLATTRWRQTPLNRPEGLVFGAQYVSVLGNGHGRYDYTVTAEMPPELIAGTGWSPGTVIHGLLLGEGDVVYPGSGGIPIMTGAAVDPHGKPITTSVTIRTSSAGARIFDAGTFAWADGFVPPTTALGVSASSFERFNENVLAWLGVPAGA